MVNIFLNLLAKRAIIINLKLRGLLLMKSFCYHLPGKDFNGGNLRIIGPSCFTEKSPFEVNFHVILSSIFVNITEIALIL